MTGALPRPYIPVTQLLTAVMQIAAEHHRAGRTAAARAMYQEVLALDPRHADALFLLGVLDRQDGRLEEARRRLSEAARWAADRAPMDAELRYVEQLLARRKPQAGADLANCRPVLHGLLCAGDHGTRLRAIDIAGTIMRGRQQRNDRWRRRISRHRYGMTIASTCCSRPSNKQHSRLVFRFWPLPKVRIFTESPPRSSAWGWVRIARQSAP